MDRLRNFGFLMRDVSRLYSRNFERQAGDLNLTLVQCKVLGYLQRNEGMSQARLAELTDTDPMTLVRSLDRMERDGLIERRADPIDRRARQVYVTQAATPVLKQMWQIGDRARSQMLAGFSAADRDQLMDLLSRMQVNLSALVPASSEATRQTAARRANKAIGDAKPAAKKTTASTAARSTRNKL